MKPGSQSGTYELRHVIHLGNNSELTILSVIEDKDPASLGQGYTDKEG